MLWKSETRLYHKHPDPRQLKKLVFLHWPCRRRHHEDRYVSHSTTEVVKTHVHLKFQFKFLYVIYVFSSFVISFKVYTRISKYIQKLCTEATFTFAVGHEVLEVNWSLKGTSQTPLMLQRSMGNNDHLPSSGSPARLSSTLGKKCILSQTIQFIASMARNNVFRSNIVYI